MELLFYDDLASAEKDFQAGKLDASIWLDLAHPFPLDKILDALAATRTRKVVKALVKIRG